VNAIFARSNSGDLNLLIIREVFYKCCLLDNFDSTEDNFLWQEDRNTERVRRTTIAECTTVTQTLLNWIEPYYSENITERWRILRMKNEFTYDYFWNSVYFSNFLWSKILLRITNGIFSLYIYSSQKGRRELSTTK